jgi:hypothetical protein
MSSSQAWCQDVDEKASVKLEAARSQSSSTQTSSPTGQAQSAVTSAAVIKNLPAFRKADVLPLAVACVPDVGIIGCMSLVFYREHKANQLVKHWLLRNHPEVASYINSREPLLIEVCANNTYVNNGNPRPGKLFGLADEMVSINQLSSNLATGKYKVLVDMDLVDLSDEGSAIRDFVASGGYFLLSGGNSIMLWQLFPGLIDPSPLPFNRDKLVDAELFEPENSLTKNLPKKCTWWLPQYSPAFEIVNQDTVSALVSSEGLKSQASEGGGIIAATFPYGKGYVLCLSGSINRCNGLTGTYSPDLVKSMKISTREALVANFIAAGLNRTACATEPIKELTAVQNRL